MPTPLRYPPKPKRPARQSGGQWILVVACLGILGGLGLAIYDTVRGPAQPADTGGAATPAAQPGPQVALASVSPALLVQAEIPAGMQAQDFVPAASLLPLDEGKTLTLRCLLRSRLDPHTEKVWRLAGILDVEKGAAEPMVRTVKVANSEELSLIVDWHVEKVSVVSEVSSGPTSALLAQSSLSK